MMFVGPLHPIFGRRVRFGLHHGGAEGVGEGDDRGRRAAILAERQNRQAGLAAGVEDGDVSTTKTVDGLLFVADDKERWDAGGRWNAKRSDDFVLDWIGVLKLVNEQRAE